MLLAISRNSLCLLRLAFATGAMFASMSTLAILDDMPMALAQEREAASPQSPTQPGAQSGDLGVELRGLTGESLNVLGLKQAHALLVVLPAPGGAAAGAGLQPGDVIVALDEAPVSGLKDFVSAIKQRGAGGVARLGLLRGRERLSLVAHLGARGDRQKAPDRVEQAIAAHEGILKVFSRDFFPRDWARTQNGLGLAYRDRIQGSRADNLEQAIKAHETALTVFTAAAYPEDWARTQRHLGAAYADRIRGSRANNLEQAIKAHEAALTVFTAAAHPEDWARTQRNLGYAYRIRIQGNRADNLEQAIKAHEAALTIFTAAAFPEEWATTQRNLGNDYRSRIQGSRADNLEQAIKAFEAALTVQTASDFPQDWAQTQNGLGLAYRDRIQGSRADNLEQAIKAYEAALAVRTAADFPQDWATTQSNLGSAYADRIQGSRADNLEQAIKAHEAALTVQTATDFPQDWAQTQVKLAFAYRNRIQGSRADNLELAIKADEAALTVYTTAATFPRDWAGAQNCLGNDYRSRIRGSRAENLELAIKAYEAALTVRTAMAFPQDWATTQSNLGLAYQDRIQSSRSENIELAIKADEAALTVYTAAAFPQDWATTKGNLGFAYASRIQGSRAENLEQAIKAFEAALTVHTIVAFPRDRLRTGRALGQALSEKRNWLAAGDAYASAREAFLILFGQGVEEDESRDLIAEAGSMFAEAAYAEVELGHGEGALTLLSEGKAQRLTVALRQQSLDLPPEKRARHAVLKTEIREWSRLADAEGIDGARALQRLSALRQELALLLKEALAKDAESHSVMAIARHYLPNRSALIAPIITESGGKLLIVTRAKDAPSVSVLDVPDLTAAQLNTLMRGDGTTGKSGWFRDFGIQYLPWQEQSKRLAEWRDAIDGIGPDLWRLFAGRLDAGLQQLGVKDGAQLVWLPTGALGLLPLQLARDPATARRFADAYEIVNVPSLEAYATAARQAAQRFAPSLAATVNPTGEIRSLDLPFTEIEGALVASHFLGKPQVRLDKSNATPEVVLAALKGKSYWHFASHGFFDWNDARKAGLLMKDSQPLSIGALLDAEGSLGHPRLVVLSACETGLYDASRSPDEFVGLPATFMQLGATGVIGSLWQVDDLATALLMAKFYDLHLDQGVAPPAALKQAQAWLREATKAQVIAYGKAAAAKGKLEPQKLAELEREIKARRRSTDTRSGALWNLIQADVSRAGLRKTAGKQKPEPRPFAHPFYWGGFVYTGL
jgi:CHAT domain-containing protein